MSSSIHDEVQDALKGLQGESKDLELLAGHELQRLRDALEGARNAIASAKVGRDYEEPEIEAGAGAIDDGPHPEAVASEPQPVSDEEAERRAAKEPDPGVREKVRASAKQSQARGK